MKSKKSGIYIITNTVNDKSYIGSTTDLNSRWYSHHHSLCCNRHANWILQAAWDKHGKDAFEFGVLEHVDAPEELYPAERFWVNAYLEEGRTLYNLAPVPPNGTKRRGKGFSKCSSSPFNEKRERLLKEIGAERNNGSGQLQWLLVDEGDAGKVKDNLKRWMTRYCRLPLENGVVFIFEDDHMIRRPTNPLPEDEHKLDKWIEIACQTPKDKRISGTRAYKNKLGEIVDTGWGYPEPRAK